MEPAQKKNLPLHLRDRGWGERRRQPRRGRGCRLGRAGERRRKRKNRNEGRDTIRFSLCVGFVAS